MIGELLEQPDRRATLAASGLDYVRQNHDWRRICDNLERFYTLEVDSTTTRGIGRA
jgi:hypothetical protein